MSDASSSELRCVRGFSQTCPPSHAQNIVHRSLEQLQAAVRHLEVWQLHRMSCSISGGADSVPVALFVAAEYARGQAPNHTLLGLHLVVTLEVLPSIPQLADVLCVHFR